MSKTSMECPSCGASASGKFCHECGKALGGRTCPHCAKPIGASTRFCSGCGKAVLSGGRSRSLPWLIAAAASLGLMVLLIVALARREPRITTLSAQTSLSSGSTVSVPPDISNLTPRERFDRLYNRVMSAAEAGDQTTVAQFTPMAIMAYEQLDRVDTDARYHVALLKVHSNQVDAVLSLADTILTETPGHLFGYMIRGAVARFNKDDTGLRRAYADFREHFEAEMKAGRSEYTDHRRAVEEFQRAATES